MTLKQAGEQAGRRRALPFIAALLLLVPAFIALGAWQMQRLAWKEALIARTARAATAAALVLPELPANGDLSAYEYRRLVLSGTYQPQGAALVATATELGSGYWLMMPLRVAPGRAIYINRGFVPIGSKADDFRRAAPAGWITVTGIVRLDQPGGTWLRANRPDEDRWYSRDVAAMARRHGIGIDPRLFVDAQFENPPDARAPVQGLTVLRFPNNHFAYALTWFALAALSAAGAIVAWRRRA